MKTHSLPILLASAVLLFSSGLSPVVCAQPPDPSPSTASLSAIFNGRDFTGWKVPEPNPFWRIEDGVLIGENDEKLTGSLLFTEASYGDFVFEADVRWTGDIDSGFFVRKPALQLQIGTSASLKRDMTGSFYTGGRERYPEAGQARDMEKLLRPGEWNTFRLEARGDTFTCWINGRQVSQYTDAKFAAPAPIGLQVHPNKVMRVEFRNVRAAALR